MFPTVSYSFPTVSLQFPTVSLQFPTVSDSSLQFPTVPYSFSSSRLYSTQRAPPKSLRAMAAIHPAPRRTSRMMIAGARPFNWRHLMMMVVVIMIVVIVYPKSFDHLTMSCFVFEVYAERNFMG